MHEDSLPQTAIETVFRIVFAGHIKNCQLTDLSPQCLRAQYASGELAKMHIWSKILQPPDTPQEVDVRRQLRARIQDALALSGNESSIEAVSNRLPSFAKTAANIFAPSL